MQECCPAKTRLHFKKDLYNSYYIRLKHHLNTFSAKPEDLVKKLP